MKFYEPISISVKLAQDAGAVSSRGIVHQKANSFLFFYGIAKLNSEI